MANGRSTARFAVHAVETLEQRVLLSTTLDAKISFQPEYATVPSGCVVDSGALFGPQEANLVYGWDRDLTKRTRVVPSKFEEAVDYDAYIAANKGKWEIEVAPGVYSVTVVAGNGKAGLRQRVEVEGTPLIDDRTSRDTPILNATIPVSVTDGRLTVAPLGNFKGNKLAWIEIRSSDGQPAPPSAGAPEPGATPTTIQWTETSIRTRQTRVEAAVATVGTNLYLMGGYVDGLSVNRTSDVFDASTGVWRNGPIVRGAQTHAGVTSDGSKMIYKAGGQSGGGIPGTPIAEVWSYNTVDGDWSRLPNLPEARYAPGMAYLNGKLHVFGGTLPDRTTVTTDHWTLDLSAVKQGWQPATPLPEAGDHLSTVVLNGQIYAIGGEHGHATAKDQPAPYIQHTYLLRYDPQTSAWTTLADMPVGRSHAEGTTIAVEGKILFMGGKLNPTDVSERVDLYDPATNTWTQIGKLPVANQGGAAIYHQGRIYLSHGQIGGPTFTMHDRSWVGALSFV